MRQIFALTLTNKYIYHIFIVLLTMSVLVVRIAFLSQSIKCNFSFLDVLFTILFSSIYNILSSRIE